MSEQSPLPPSFCSYGPLMDWKVSTRLSDGHLSLIHRLKRSPVPETPSQPRSEITPTGHPLAQPGRHLRLTILPLVGDAELECQVQQEESIWGIDQATFRSLSCALSACLTLEDTDVGRSQALWAGGAVGHSGAESPQRRSLVAWARQEAAWGHR